MRNIKFRAWLKEENRMLDKVALTWPGSEMIIQWYDSLEDYYAGALTDCSERDCVVMQYTRLNDKNGKEIYEGDRFSLGSDIGTVVFKNGMYLIDWDTPFTWGIDVILYRLHDQGEVNGNIYEGADQP